jgi:hypothetical protein
VLKSILLFFCSLLPVIWGWSDRKD